MSQKQTDLGKVDRYDEAHLCVFKIQNSIYNRRPHRTSDDRSPIISRDQKKSSYWLTKQKGRDISCRQPAKRKSNQNAQTSEEERYPVRTTSFFLLDESSLFCYPKRFVCRTPSLMPSFLRQKIRKKENQSNNLCSPPRTVQLRTMLGAWSKEEGQTRFCMYQPRPDAMHSFVLVLWVPNASSTLEFLFSLVNNTESMLRKRDVEKRRGIFARSIRPEPKGPPATLRSAHSSQMYSVRKVSSGGVCVTPFCRSAIPAAVVASETSGSLTCLESARSRSFLAAFCACFLMSFLSRAEMRGPGWDWDVLPLCSGG
jgi:hypothetical protein